MNTQSGMVNTQSGNWTKVFTMNRIECSRTIGLGVHDKPDWVFTMGRNMQPDHIIDLDAISKEVISENTKDPEDQKVE